MSFQPTISQQKSFIEDGFVVVDRLVDPKQLPVLHKALDDLLR
jgi:hypothetical protein